MPDLDEAQMVRDEVLGAITQWLAGNYTDVLADGFQRRLSVEEVDDNFLLIKTQRLGRHGGLVGRPKLHKLFVEVKSA